MSGELDIYGVFVPALFAWLLIAFGLYLLTRRTLQASGAYQFIWHRPLFDVALYVILLGLVVVITHWLAP